mmetsp:Transcript_27416/g.77414  ORF Transcript_27416/g.77414 Transcript_27416/m.77414 type:complete len:101 (+) Transcript_27416:2632-2934(+)
MPCPRMSSQGRGHRVFVHCHAGVGRTGDMAIALSEILCDSTPSNPKEKLLWLRQFRKGLVQTAEQLIDGLQLATTLLDVRGGLCILVLQHWPASVLGCGI